MSMKDGNNNAQSQPLANSAQALPYQPVEHDTARRTPDIRFSGDDYESGHHGDVPVPSTNPMNSYFMLNQDAIRRNMDAGLSLRQSPPPQENSSSLHDLHIKTDFYNLRRNSSVASSEFEPRMRSSASAASLTQRMPSVRSWLHSTAGSVSPGSMIGSPQIAAMLDITPLPSPTINPLESWKMLARSRSRASSTSSKADFPPSISSAYNPFVPTSPRKKYAGLQAHGHRVPTDDRTAEDETVPSRNRSISEYAPEPMVVPKQRQHAVSSTGGPPPDLDPQTPNLHREAFLGPHRGVSPMVPKIESSLAYNDPTDKSHKDELVDKKPKTEIYSANSISTGTARAYESLRLLGQGTFSKVFLAVRLMFDKNEGLDYRSESTNMAGVRARSRRLVAVKVVEPGPAGGADAERIEVSLKREVELMKLIQHPSIVHLKAFGTDTNGRALLVMNFCPGGDLFDLASNQTEVLTPRLIQRIFAELVSAVRYLHQKFIVHRDIKLENVLLNIPVQVHGDVHDWQTLDRAVVTLTDLGLSRRIPSPPESPLLETRCGSEDYAAPEILMGQPYDGRQTDAWALGVLLYALMEGRLPFDPLPGVRGDPATLKARTPHRIARCEWGWVRYGDEDNEWDSEKGRDFKGAEKCIEGLLKRNTRRMPLAEIREHPWVQNGIRIDGGLRWVEEENL